MYRFTPLAVATLMAGLSAGAFAAGTDLQKCAAIDGKALAAIVDALVKESAKLCAKGAAQNAADATLAPAAKMVGAFQLKTAQGMDKYGADNCLLEPDSLAGGVADIAAEAQGLADIACSAVVN